MLALDRLLRLVSAKAIVAAVLNKCRVVISRYIFGVGTLILNVVSNGSFLMFWIAILMSGTSLGILRLNTYVLDESGDLRLDPWKDILLLNLSIVLPSLLDLSLVHHHELLVLKISLSSIFVLKEDLVSQIMT